MPSCAPRIASLALGLLVVAACGRAAQGPARAIRDRRPGIVLIVVDTLRADAVPLDDSEPTLLPSLRTFAAGATSFADAFAPGAWTPQSMPSILTGLSPDHTGCEGTAETGVPALPGGVTTLAERLRYAGYGTAAYTGGGFVSASQGLSQGFDLFLPGFDSLGPESCISTWSKLRPAGVPFFLLLHSYAAHDPYGEKDARAMASAAPSAVPPSPALAQLFRGTADAPDGPDVPTLVREPGVLRECTLEWILDGPARPANARLVATEPGRALFRAMHGWLDGGYLSDLQGRAAIEERFRAAYRRGLGPTEAVLARTFAALQAARLPPDTIVIVTSDHGEAHGEHGQLTHERHLHEEILRVPLLVRAPGRVPAGAVVRGSCGPVDVAPTLLELVGISWFGDEMDGQPLVAQANGREGGHPVVSTADRPEPHGEGMRSVREISVRDDRRTWCYVYDVETGAAVAEHVFDRIEDPRSLDPRPVDAFEWRDSPLSRLVEASRNAALQRFGKPPAVPLGALTR